MIGGRDRSAAASGSTNGPVRSILQRRCACGGRADASGECAACRAKKSSEPGASRAQLRFGQVPVRPPLRINQPNDRFEQEADRAASRALTGRKGGDVSLAGGPALQREEKEKKAPKPDNYGEAAKKIGEAFLETPAGKQLKEKAAEMGADFVSSVEGKVIAGSALGGALAAIIATNSELPVPIPELPLDFIKPGLKAKITYEGPTQKPTNVGLTLTSAGGTSLSASYTKTAASPGKPAEEKAGLTLSIPLGASAPKKKGPTDSEKFGAETARLRAEQEKFRASMKTPAEKKEEQEFLKSYLRSKQNDPLNPLTPGKKKDDLLLMRSANTQSAPETAPAAVHETLAQHGQPLDTGVRREMETRLGHDFGNVRIHADAGAAESARAVSAHAYTVGSHVVFDQSRYAPETPAGRRLLAHELAHVVQQRGSEERVQRENYYASGYQQIHKSVDEEIAAAQRKQWHPATADMAATATGSGGGEPIATFDEFLKKIEGKAKGSITRLNLLGHSNSTVFSFGGTITKDNVEFSPDAALYADVLKTNADRIAKLRDRFAKDAKIVLYSCDAGTGKELLDAVGSAFGVCVEGFTSEIWWCITKTKDGTAVRGRVWAQNPHDPLPPDHPPDCNSLSPNITTLTTGGKSTQCGEKKNAP